MAENFTHGTEIAAAVVKIFEADFQDMRKSQGLPDTGATRSGYMLAMLETVLPVVVECMRYPCACAFPADPTCKAVIHGR